MVREVEKPNAPARTASAVISRMRAMSSWLASSRFNGAVAHDVDAHRRVRQQGAEVDVVLAAFQRGQVLGETFPGPVEAFVQAGAGQVLDAFHQRDDGVLRVLAAPARSRRRNCP